MSVQENIKRKEEALAKLKEHCLCFKVDGNIVFLPEGYEIDGLKIDETAEGYLKAETKLEEIWKDSLYLFSVGETE